MQPLTVLTAQVCKRQPPVHVILECPGTQPVWQLALAKAAEAMEGHPMQGAWTAMNEAAQRGHLPLLGSTCTCTAIFPLEVEQHGGGFGMESNPQSYGLGPQNVECAAAHFHYAPPWPSAHCKHCTHGIWALFGPRPLGHFFHLNSTRVRNLDETSANSTLVYGVSTPVMEASRQKAHTTFSSCT